jgi:isopenicillin-N N-acyltransferase-like protein
MPELRLLEVCGNPFEMGFQHGLAHRDAIREIAAERLKLACESEWAGVHTPTDEVIALAEQCLSYHCEYAPELMWELEGISAATGVTMTELLIMNGFTDFVDTVYNAPGIMSLPLTMEVRQKALLGRGNECTTFMVGGDRTAAGAALIGQTWDMHETATPYVALLRGYPNDAPRFLTLTLTGSMGMIGMNEHGISVGINNLSAATGQPGVTWTFVVRKILMQDNLEAALECITSAKLAGGHNYLIMDEQGRGYNVEAMPQGCVVTSLRDEPVVHANRCLDAEAQREERPLSEDWIEDSEARERRAYGLLHRTDVTPETMMEITRDRSDGSYSICAFSEEPYFSETCGAVVMRPASRELWGIWGLPCEGEYERHFV